jgi:hypothetical protein
MKIIKTALYWANKPYSNKLPDWREDRRRRLFPEKSHKIMPEVYPEEEEQIEIEGIPEEVGEILETRESTPIPQGRFISDDDIFERAKKIYRHHYANFSSDEEATANSLQAIAEELRNRSRNLDLFFPLWGTGDLDQLAYILDRFVAGMK